MTEELPLDTVTVIRSETELPIGRVIKTAMTDYEVVKCIPHPAGGWQVSLVAIAIHVIDIETGRRVSA